MAKIKHRKVNAVAFGEQLAEMVIAPDSLAQVFVDRAETESIWVKVPFNLDEDDDYVRRISGMSTGKEMALEMLGHHPSLTAEEQWATWEAAGHDAKLLINIVGNLRQEAEDRQKNFRYRG